MIKVGDILIPDDEFIAYTGTAEFEVLETKEIQSELFIDGTATEITLGGNIPIHLPHGDFREYRTIKTIDHKVNPEPHVSKGWNLHGKYCKAIFFTSEEQKQNYTKRYREMKMNNYLHLARKYGYEVESHEQETFDEAALKWVFQTNGHKWSNNDDTAGDNYGSFIAGAKWQTQRMYSEEEVYELLCHFFDDHVNAQDANIAQWFEQNKKKIIS